MKIAIIGSGIAGNVAAYRLHRDHEITVYEADARIGGHTHTHTVTQAGRSFEVDTGFIVYNEWTYPQFTALLAGLGVVSQPTTMSFSVRNDFKQLEYNGTTINTLFAQRRNLVRPSFLAMVRDILRFNREAPGMLGTGIGEQPLGELLRAGRYSRPFVDDYIIPMGAAIWSTSPRSMLSFPARFFVRFLMNHGMLSVNDRPQWRTVAGGSARYVEKLVAPFRDRIRLRTPVEYIRRQPGSVFVKAQGQQPQRYDAVFLACHSDQALQLLADATTAEREVLGAIPYQRNEAVLHTDIRLMPRRRLAWACWNYHSLPDNAGPLALTYNMNMLQNLDAPEPLLVTLNRSDVIDPARVILRANYDHPVFTPGSVAAQARHRELNGVQGTYFCGAWWGHGFHEDGVASALAAVTHFEQDHAQRAVHRTA
ncbi:MAG TPA: FAD-dependent oxidoreductase [Steroidobacteraceae bacterium]|nr:FAD-dependent oxidoreductase [Steroidobacteraceae bacterium]